MTDAEPAVPTAPRRRLRPAAPRQDAAQAPSQADPPRSRPGGASRETDRGLRMLVSNAPTRLNVDAAMRTRDASQPTPDQLAAAERDVVVVHRGWTPPP